MVWAVDVDKLCQVVGSKDEKLRRMLGGRFKRDIAELDEMFESPNTYEALRQIIDGAIPEKASGGVYAYAFRLVVQHFGKPLPNAPFMPWSSPDFAPAHAALDAMGVPLELDRFYSFELPVRLPYPDDFPCAGYVSNAETKSIHEAFAGAKKVAVDDAQTAEVVSCAEGWFRTAASMQRGLVGYYH